MPISSTLNINMESIYQFCEARLAWVSNQTSVPLVYVMQYFGQLLSRCAIWVQQCVSDFLRDCFDTYTLNQWQVSLSLATALAVGFMYLIHFRTNELLVFVLLVLRYAGKHMRSFCISLGTVVGALFLFILFIFGAIAAYSVYAVIASSNYICKRGNYLWNYLAMFIHEATLKYGTSKSGSVSGHTSKGLNAQRPITSSLQKDIQDKNDENNRLKEQIDFLKAQLKAKQEAERREDEENDQIAEIELRRSRRVQRVYPTTDFYIKTSSGEYLRRPAFEKLPLMFDREPLRMTSTEAKKVLRQFREPKAVEKAVAAMDTVEAGVQTMVSNQEPSPATTSDKSVQTDIPAEEPAANNLQEQEEKITSLEGPVTDLQTALVATTAVLAAAKERSQSSKTENEDLRQRLEAQIHDLSSATEGQEVAVKEIQCLKTENEGLQSQVQQLAGNVLAARQAAAGPRKI